MRQATLNLLLMSAKFSVPFHEHTYPFLICTVFSLEVHDILQDSCKRQSVSLLPLKDPKYESHFLDQLMLDDAVQGGEGSAEQSEG